MTDYQRGCSLKPEDEIEGLESQVSCLFFSVQNVEVDFDIS